LQNPALRGDFRAQTASQFNGLQRNSLCNGTGNFSSNNREFSAKNREFSRPSSDCRKSKAGGREEVDHEEERPHACNSTIVPQMHVCDAR
jgi:hypothetical protein